MSRYCLLALQRIVAVYYSESDDDDMVIVFKGCCLATLPRAFVFPLPRTLFLPLQENVTTVFFVTSESVFSDCAPLSDSELEECDDKSTFPAMVVKWPEHLSPLGGFVCRDFLEVDLDGEESPSAFSLVNTRFTRLLLTFWFPIKPISDEK